MRRLGTILIVVLVIAAGVSAFIALEPTTSASGAAGGARGGRSGASLITNQVTVGKGSVVFTASATGTIVPAQQSNLTFTATGLVRDIKVQQGQTVTAGQV